MRRWMAFGMFGLVLTAAAVILKRRLISSGQHRLGGQAEDLVALPKTKLYERARREKIAGRSGMTKAELVEALSHHEY